MPSNSYSIFFSSSSCSCASKASVFRKTKNKLRWNNFMKWNNVVICCNFDGAFLYVSANDNGCFVFLIAHSAAICRTSSTIFLCQLHPSQHFPDHVSDFCFEIRNIPRNVTIWAHSTVFHWQEQRSIIACQSRIVRYAIVQFFQSVHFAQREAFLFKRRFFFHKLPQIILLL